MGEVYRAHDGKLSRDVAIKILPRAFAADLDRLARFRREVHLRFVGSIKRDSVRRLLCNIPGNWPRHNPAELTCLSADWSDECDHRRRCEQIRSNEHIHNRQRE